MIQIVNIRNNPKGRYLYIGRANKFYSQEESIFHNPFVIGKDGTRAEVIEKFRKYAPTNKELMDSLHLLDKENFLGCYCDYPHEDCHGRILIELREAQLGNRKCICIIAGGRKLNTYDYVRDAANESGFKIEEVVSGTADGIDVCGELFALNNKLKLKRFPAQWDDLTVKNCVVKVNNFGKQYNALAGHNRNKEMAEYATHLILIWDGKSTGSANMLKQAKEKGLTIYEKIIK
jgi:hypothetical protein